MNPSLIKTHWLDQPVNVRETTEIERKTHLLIELILLDSPPSSREFNKKQDNIREKHKREKEELNYLIELADWRDQVFATAEKLESLIQLSQIGSFSIRP